LKDLKMPDGVQVMSRSGTWPKAAPPPAVSQFVEFVLSSAGAAVIVANGAVPVK
jgi:hypothetical protein